MESMLNYLSGYLPHKLMVKVFDDKPKVMIASGSSSSNWVGIGAVVKWIDNCKPILVNLSDIFDKDMNPHKCLLEIEELCDISSGFHLWFNFSRGNYDIDLPLKAWDILYKHHIDIHSLIDKKLAIDIKTIVI